MGKLIYLLNVSLDGYIETADRSLSWTIIDDELHSWFNDQMRAIDATIYGRRLYEVMAAYWPTGADDPNGTPVTREFAAIWNPLPKFVFSRTLTTVHWNSRLVQGDVGDVLAQLKREFEGDIGVAGANTAAEFIRRGLVDEYRLVVHPVVLGGGTPYFPTLESSLPLRLIDSHTFSSGVTYLGYAAA